jgi:hypothetical protein
VICSPDSSINTTEILLKVASCIRLVFDYIYLLFVPLTLQIMAAEYTSDIERRAYMSETVFQQKYNLDENNKQ